MSIDIFAFLYYVDRCLMRVAVLVVRDGEIGIGGLFVDAIA